LGGEKVEMQQHIGDFFRSTGGIDCSGLLKLNIFADKG